MYLGLISVHSQVRDMRFNLYLFLLPDSFNHFFFTISSLVSPPSITRALSTAHVQVKYRIKNWIKQFYTLVVVVPVRACEFLALPALSGI